MGVGFSHGSASWSYTGFGRFRRAIAAAEGITLDVMTGFGGDLTWNTVVTPLRPLLEHSDCDGELSPQDCATIAPVLRRTVPRLFGPGTYDFQAGLALADGMDASCTRRPAPRTASAWADVSPRRRGGWPATPRIGRAVFVAVLALGFLLPAAFVLYLALTQPEALP